MKREPILIIQESREPTTGEYLLACFFRVPVESVQRQPTKADVTKGLAIVIPAAFALGWVVHGWLG